MADSYLDSGAETAAKHLLVGGVEAGGDGDVPLRQTAPPVNWKHGERLVRSQATVVL